MANIGNIFVSCSKLSSHPKSKEWMVSASNGNYQELAKLASEHPELTQFKVGLDLFYYTFVGQVYRF